MHAPGSSKFIPRLAAGMLFMLLGVSCIFNTEENERLVFHPVSRDITKQPCPDFTFLVTGGGKVQTADIVIRHTSEYRYRTLTLYCDRLRADTLVRRDTLALQLSRTPLRWQGQGLDCIEYAAPLPPFIPVYAGLYHLRIHLAEDSPELRAGLIAIGLHTQG